MDHPHILFENWGKTLYIHSLFICDHIHVLHSVTRKRCLSSQWGHWVRLRWKRWVSSTTTLMYTKQPLHCHSLWRRLADLRLPTMRTVYFAFIIDSIRALYIVYTRDNAW